MTDLLTGIEGITFDLWNTLIVGGNPGYRAGKIAAIQKHLATHPEQNLLEKLLKEAASHCNALSEETGIDYSFAARIARVYERIPHKKIPLLTRDILTSLEQELGEVIKLYPPFLCEKDLVVSLTTLKSRGFKIGIISNVGTITGSNMRIALERLGVLPLVDTTIFSDEAKVAKPNPQIFWLAAQSLCLDPHTMLHIGDNLNADVKGAQNAGLRALHYAPHAFSSVKNLINEIRR